MGILFKKVKEKEIIKIEKKFQQKDVLTSFIKAITEIGDFEDYKILALKAAEIFFEDNKSIFESLTTLSKDNLNILIDLINCFFAAYKLGSVEIEIDEDNGEVFIIHYASPFRNIFKNEKSCIFLVEFYKKLFEFILDEKLRVKEEECGVNNEKCIFKVSI